MASYMPLPKLVEELSKIMQAHSGSIYARAVVNGLALGRDPGSPTHLVDFSSESVRPLTDLGDTREPAEITADDLSGVYRRRGVYWFDVRGVRDGCVSLKHLLAESLKAIEAAVPGTLEKLSHVKPRSRRIVARHKKDLFDEVHLAEQFAEPLMDGWWYGTNNSAEGTRAWLQRACSCAGLQWGKDFNTNLRQEA